MDLFIETVAASAEVSSFITTDPEALGNTMEPVVTDYVRPTAAQSDYLDKASSQHTGRRANRCRERIR